MGVPSGNNHNYMTGKDYDIQIKTKIICQKIMLLINFDLPIVLWAQTVAIVLWERHTPWYIVKTRTFVTQLGDEITSTASDNHCLTFSLVWVPLAT